MTLNLQDLRNMTNQTELEIKTKFQIHTDKPLHLRNSLEIVKEFVDESNITLDENGLRINVPDKSMVCLIDLKVDRKYFTVFDIKEKSEIGLNIGSLCEVLNKLDKGEELLIEQKSKMKLGLNIISKLERNYKMPILELSKEDIPKTSDLEFKANFDVKTKDILIGVKDSDIISDSLGFTVENNVLHLLCKGDIKEYDLPIPIETTVSEKISSRYPLDYLKKLFSKAVKEFDTVKIFINNDFPMKLIFDNGLGITLEFLLAPRVSDD